MRMLFNMDQIRYPIQGQQMPFVSYHGASQSPPALGSQQSCLLYSSYIRRGFPDCGRFEVKITSILQGPYGFTVQLTNEECKLLSLQDQLKMLPHFPFESNLPIGAPCVMLSWDKKFYRGCITAARAEEFIVEKVDWGTFEVCDWTRLRQISEDLLRLPTVSFRVSLEDAEMMIHHKGVEKFFNDIVKSTPVLVAQAIHGAPNRVVLLNAEGRSIRDIIADLFGFPRSAMRATSRTPSPLLDQVLHGYSATIPHNNLDSEEFLQVLHTREHGWFFGLLNKNPKGELEELTLEMATLYGRIESKPLLYADVRSHVGQFGVIRLDKESQYCRVKILLEKVNHVKVLLIDDGRRMIVARNDVLAPLSTLTCFKHPPFGIECKVENLPLSLTQWSSLSEKKVIVHVKIEAAYDDCYTVSFTDDICNGIVKFTIAERQSESEGRISPVNSESPDLRGDNCKYRNGANGNKLVREGFSQYQHPNAASRNESTKSQKDINWRSGNVPSQEVIRIPRGPPPMKVNGKMPTGFLNNLVQQIQVIQQAQPANQPVPQPSISPPQKAQSTSTVAPAKSPTPSPPSNPTYPVQTPLGRITKIVQIVFIEEVDSFYVQLSESLGDISSLQNKLQKLCKDGLNAPLDSPTVGTACVAKYADDSNWYRGQIMNLYEQDVDIVFVDYGNKQRTPLTDIKAIKSDILNLQPQAYLCRMACTNVPRASMESKKKIFIEKSLGQLFEATFSGQDMDGKYRVRLFESKGVHRVINEVFGAYPIRDVKRPESRYTHPKLPSASSDFIVGKFYSVDRFYLKPCDIANSQEKLALLEEFYSSLGEEELVESEPLINLSCVVKCNEDGKFHRSLIISLDGDMATVIFVDSGHQRQAPCKSLKRLLTSFMEFPTLAVECGLRLVKPISNLTSDRQQLLNECFVEGEFVKVIVNETAADSFEADVTHPKHGDLAKYFLDNGVVELPTAPAVFATKFNPQDLNAPAALKCYDNVMVSHAPSPFEFWAQLATSVVDNLMEDIKAYRKTLEFQDVGTFKPEAGKVCLARYSGDGEWYRAYITDVNDEQVMVHYVDYGNSSDVTCTELRALPMHLAKEPSLAVKCTLQDANNIPEERQPEFVELLYDPVNLRVVKRVDDVLHVCLILQDGQNLCEKLMGRSAFMDGSPQETASEPQVAQTMPATTSSEIIRNLNLESESAESQLIGSSTEVTTKEIVGSEEEVNGCISTAVSPGDFWIWHSHGATDDEIRELQEAMKNLHSQTDMEAPSIGEVYGVRHPDLNEWFRARIISVDGTGVKVHFIDRGDSQLATIDDVCQLPARCKTVRDLAVHCSLKVPEGHDGWSMRALKVFQEHAKPDVACRVKFGVLENKTFKVESLHIQGVDLVETIYAALNEDTFEILQHISSSTSFPNLGSLTTVTEYTEVDSELVTCDMSATEQTYTDLSVSTADSIIQSASRTSEVTSTSKSEEQFADQLTPLTKTFTPGQIISQAQAEICDISSVEGVVLSLDQSALANITELVRKIEDPRALPLLEPQVGRACLSLYPRDGSWCRAVILEVLQASAKVYYADYGNVNEVKLEDLRRLPAFLAEAPAVGLECGLAGIDKAPPTLAHETLKKLIGTKHITVVFVSETFDQVYVQLLDENGVDLIKQLKASERERSILNQSAVKAVFGDATMASVLVDDTALDVTAQASDSVLIEAMLKKEPIEPSLIALPESNSDATVTNKSKTMGHEGVIKCDLMQETAELIVTSQPEPHLAKPLIVFHMGNFEGLEVQQNAEQGETVVGANSEPADPSQSELHEMKLSSETESLAEKAKSTTTAEQSVLGSVGNVNTGLMVAYESTNSASVDNGENFSTNQITKELAIKPREKEMVYISHVIATDHFWVQDMSENFPFIESYMKKTKFNEADFVLNEHPVVGVLYAVFHIGYNDWFRGRVISMNTRKCQADVFFVDYGDSCTANFAVIRKLPDCIASKPPCAKECKCASLGQDRDLWDEEATRAFNKICLDTPVEAVFNTRLDDGVSDIEMLYINGRMLIDLIKERLCEKLRGSC